MARTWSVSFTAKRKRVIYERQDVTVTFNELEHAELFDSSDSEGPDQMEIEQLAVEKGETLLDDGAWETYSADTETLDETGFEVKGTTEA